MTRLWRQPNTCAASASPRFCTCGAFASSVMRAATPRSVIAAVPRSARTSSAIPSSTPRACSWRPGSPSPASCSPDYDAVATDVRRLADDAANQRRLSSASEVMEPIARRRPESVASDVSRAASPDARASAFGGKPPEEAGPLTLAESINVTLADALAARPEILVFGEDVGRKGGVYGVTRGLQRRFGVTRVFDTLLDEQTILGVALGCGVSGLLPVPEIQYLAYLHNAEDQLRGEAATLPFFSNGQYQQPDGAADRRIRLPKGIRRPFP